MRTITPARVLWIGILLISPAFAAEPSADFYVATDGNDAWSGQLAAPDGRESDGPFATLDRAREAVRALREMEPDRREPIVVAIRGGTYYLDEPIVFSPDDSGTAEAPIIYRAHENERPIFSGGTRITGWEVGDDGRWRVTLPQVKSGDWSFSQLFVSGQRRFRPRLPGEGYYTIAEQIPSTEANREKGHDRFVYSGDDLRADWANLDDVEVFAFHQWTASRMRIGSLDPQSHTVTFTGPTSSTSYWAGFPKGHRYLVINVKEALREPGQWYLDRPTGELTYIPREGETPDAATVIAPRLSRLFIFDGNVDKRQWVQHIQLRGLTLAHTNWNTPPQGNSFSQAAVHTPAALDATGARHILFDRCAVLHVGGYAMAFGPGSRHNTIERCEMVDLGAGGIKIGMSGGSQSWPIHTVDPDDPEAQVSHHTVRDCTIAHGGRLHPAGVGVWIGHASHNTIEHNDIFDLYYTGVSIGWTWGYDTPSRAHHNELAYNDIHTLGQGVLSDMGGVYTLGVSPGTTIHHNIFHDIHAFDYGGWGMYTDEGSSQIVMKNNLVYDTKTGSFHQHYGKDNRITNNILVNSKEWQLQRTRDEPHRSFILEHNIVYWENDSPLLGGNWKGDHYDLDHNLYWNAGKPVTFPGGLTIEQWREQRGHDQHSIIADPMFVDPAAGNFNLREGSPASRIGFEPFDVSTAGRLTQPTLTAEMPDVPSTFQPAR